MIPAGYSTPLPAVESIGKQTHLFLKPYRRYSTRLPLLIQLTEPYPVDRNPKMLQYIMGHADISVTLNTYTHVQFEDTEKEMKRLFGIG